MQTRTAQVIDALVELCAAEATFRRPSEVTYDSTLITVWDGPEFRSGQDYGGGGHLVIGFGGDDPEAQEAAASTELSAGPMAASVRPRDEELTINCRAVQDHGETPKRARDGALAVIDAVALVCRSAPDLGIDASATIGGVTVRAWVTAGTMLQYLQAGYTCEWSFTVTVRTRV
jgi:hypothetical protein